jgi:hypothetical protein
MIKHKILHEIEGYWFGLTLQVEKQNNGVSLTERNSVGKITSEIWLDNSMVRDLITILKMEDTCATT